MIHGIGTDLVSYARIHGLHARHGLRAARHILSPRELPEYEVSADPARLLMKRFAAKEALAKAVGTGLRHPVSLQHISIVHDAQGKPGFHFAEVLTTFLVERGIVRHHLSISDERDSAVAFVVLER